MNLRRGAALPIIIIVVTVITAVVALTITTSRDKDVQRVKNEMIDNVREADNALQTFVRAEYTQYWKGQLLAGNTAGSNSSVNSRTREDWYADVKERGESFILNRLGNRPGWSLQVSNLIPPSSLGSYSDRPDLMAEKQDPFRFALGNLDLTTLGQFTIDMGYKLDPADDDSYKGVSSVWEGNTVKALVVPSTNYAWLSAMEKTPIDASQWGSARLIVRPPAYLKTLGAVDNAISQVEHIGKRTSGIFINSNLVGSETSDSLIYVGLKPVILRDWVSSRKAPPIQMDTSDMPLKNFSYNFDLSTGTGATNPLANLEGLEKETDSIKWVGQDKLAGRLFLFNEEAGETELEASKVDFWNGSPSSSTPTDAWLPAREAPIVVDLSWSNTEQRPYVTDIRVGSTSVIGEAGVRDSLDEINGTPAGDGTAAQLGIKKIFADEYFKLPYRDANQPYDTQDALAQDVTAAKTAFLLNGIKESFYNGAIRIQTLPISRHAIQFKYKPVLVVDASKFVEGVGNAPAGTFSNSSRKKRGVYVNVLPTGDPIKDDILLNNAMVLIGRESTTSEPNRKVEKMIAPTGGAITDTYLAELPEQSTQYIFGTNGRLVFDTSINVNRGVKVNHTGAIVPTGVDLVTNNVTQATYEEVEENALKAVSGSTDLHTLMADGVTSANSVFVSRLRPGYTFLSMTSASKVGWALDTFGALDPNKSAEQFLAGLFQIGSGNAVSLLETTNTDVSNPFSVGNSNVSGLSGVLAAYTLEDLPEYTLGGLPNTAESSSAPINIKLRDWAKDALKQLTIMDRVSVRNSDGTLTTIENPAYHPALHVRLTQGESISVNGSNLSEQLFNELLVPMGRMETANYLKAYFQRYGWENTVEDEYRAQADYNFRLSYSGNVKSDIYRECIVNNSTGEKAFEQTPFESGRPVIVQGRPLRFENLPDANLVAIRAQASLSTNDLDLLGSGGEGNIQFLAFFAPESGNQPQNLMDVLRAFLVDNPTTPLSDIIDDWNGGEQQNTTAYTSTPGPETMLYGVSTASAGSEAKVIQKLMAHAAKIVATDAFTLKGAFGENSTLQSAWSALINNYSPFFGAVEYTIVASVDEAKPEQLAQQNGKIYAAWTFDTDNIFTADLAPVRIESVRVFQYAAATTAPTIDTTQIANEQGVQVPRQQLISNSAGLQIIETIQPFTSPESLSNLDTTFPGPYNKLIARLNVEANTLLASTVSGWSTAQRLDRILASGVFPISMRSPQIYTTTEGNIRAKRVFYPGVSNVTDGFSWTLYKDRQEVTDTGFFHAHTIPTSGDIYPYSIDMRQDSSQGQSFSASVVPALNEGGGKITYTVGQTAQEVGGMRKDLRIARYRTTKTKRYEQRSVAEIDAGLNASVIVNTTTGLGTNLLSEQLRSALFERIIKLKLFANFNGSYRTPNVTLQNDFVGVGTLVTGAATPHAILMDPTMSSNTDIERSGNFAWHGNIITGVGESWASDFDELLTKLNSTSPSNLTQTETNIRDMWNTFSQNTDAFLGLVPDDFSQIRSNTVIFGDPKLGYNVWGRIGMIQEDQRGSANRNNPTRMSIK